VELNEADWAKAVADLNKQYRRPVLKPKEGITVDFFMKRTSSVELASR